MFILPIWYFYKHIKNGVIIIYILKNFFPIAIIIIITLFSGCDKKDMLSIHIIDVGQGDSILIKTPSNKKILIDAGTDESEYIVKSYLKKEKVKYLDFVIATHPDSDHIGGLDYIINNFNVEKLYMPKQSTNSTSYNNLINACNSNSLDIKYLQKGDTINIDNLTDIYVLSPSYIQNENEIINSFNLRDVDFLKVAHHGSSSSSSPNFIKEASPDVAVISCGYKNQYGHPHKSTLDTLSKNNILTYRTDLNGDMVFYSDGNTISTKKEYIK